MRRTAAPRGNLARRAFTKKYFVRGELIEEGAENLKKLKNKIDTTKMKAPSFLMVLIGAGDYAYRRQDGIYVVPIGCLKD